MADKIFKVTLYMVRELIAFISYVILLICFFLMFIFGILGEAVNANYSPVKEALLTWSHIMGIDDFVQDLMDKTGLY